MGYRLEAFSEIGLSEALLSVLIADHERRERPRLERLWRYFRNPRGADGGAGRGRLAQEEGLPARLSGRGDAAVDDRAVSAREVVIENDIAWRVQTMVDFMLPRPVKMRSGARSAGVRERVEGALSEVWEASGGVSLLQDMALLGHVYGHADLLVRVDAGADVPVRVELVEPTRGIPLSSGGDYRRLDGYVLRFERATNDVEGWGGTASGLRRLWRRREPGAHRRGLVTVTEVFSGSRRQLYEDDGTGPRLVEESTNAVSPGVVPVVHVQNVSQPFAYAGLGEVEPLIPLQDELNTRLSDRASRVTMQSFKMYLARGIDGFGSVPIGPGQVWSTDNMDASVEAFGGDASSPSEESHVEQVREALDKVSGVPPLAAGVVRAKIGNLTSENALRVTLMGLLSRTARKRVAYGRGIAGASRLVLSALDRLGVLRTDPEDRAVRVEWPDPLPRNAREEVAVALAKRDLGAPVEELLEELGYGVGEGVDRVVS